MTAREPLTVDELNDLCVRVYHTPKWAPALAADLSRALNRPVSPTQVNQWQGKVRPLPSWVEDVLPAAFRARYRHWGDLALGARDVARELEERLMADLDAELDGKPDLAPGM